MRKAETRPDKTSSRMTDEGLWRESMYFMVSGLTISKKRKEIRAGRRSWGFCMTKTGSKVMVMPITSSTTIQDLSIGGLMTSFINRTDIK